MLVAFACLLLIAKGSRDDLKPVLLIVAGHHELLGELNEDVLLKGPGQLSCLVLRSCLMPSWLRLFFLILSCMAESCLMRIGLDTGFL